MVIDVNGRYLKVMGQNIIKKLDLMIIVFVTAVFW